MTHFQVITQLTFPKHLNILYHSSADVVLSMYMKKGVDMRSSHYNIYKKRNSKYILLNTLTGAVARIDEETKSLLEKKINKIPENILKLFYDNGFVVADDCDERKILAYHFDREKYNVIPKGVGYTVATTYACNLACPYCYEGPEKDTETLDNKKVDILLKNIERNLSKRDFKSLSITLYGGEPLLAYRQCVHLMKGASAICNEQNKEFKGDLVTNGVLINEEILNTLLKPYCDSIQITMDGGRETHDKRRIRKDGSGTYDILLDVLELLWDADINFTLKFNVDRENADTFTDLLEDLKERGLMNIKKTIGRIYPADIKKFGEGCASYTEKCFSIEEMTEYANKVREQLDITGRSKKSLIIPRYSPCTFDRDDMYVVDPYLDLYNCWEFLGQKDKKVGYIDENGKTVFNYEFYEQMSRNPFKFAECRDCVYLPMCGGGCAAEAYFEKGTYHSSPCGEGNYSLQRYMEQCIDILGEEMVSVSSEES